LDLSLVIAKLLICDLLALKVVPGHNLVNLIFSILSELIVSHLNLNDVRVTLQRVLQRSCVALFNLITRDVQLFDGFVQFQILS